MSDLRRARDSSRGIKITNGGPFGDLHREKTVLRAQDGPRLVVDLNEELVLTYLPGLIGKGQRVSAYFLGDPSRPYSNGCCSPCLNVL